MKCFKCNSNRIIALLIIAAMLVGMVGICSGPTYAASQSLRATGYISPKEGAILRSGTSTSTKRLTVLKYNSKVVVTGEFFVSKTNPKNTNKWYSVTVNNRKGYVRGDLIKNIKYSSKKAKSTDDLYYRVGPAKTMKRAGMSKKGNAIEVVMEARMQGSKELWYKIKKGNKYYYSSSKWISFTKEASKTTKPQSTSATTTTTTTTTTTKPQTTGTTESTPAKAVTVKNTVSDAVYPSKIVQGSSFVISGKVNSTVTITEGVVKVLNSAGKTVLSAKKKNSSKTFNISTLDPDIRFGNLGAGKYVYVVQVTANGESYKVLNKSFTVIKAKKAELIAKQAKAISWPLGTSSRKYSYSTGYATQAYKKALNKAYPDRSRWGAPPRAGASCDVFVGTVIRSSGVDTQVPRGLQEQFPYFKNSKKWKRVSYNGNRSVLRTGDIILYTYNGGAHILVYIKEGSREYVAEANYSRTYGMLSDGYAVKDRTNKNNKNSHYVYRIVE